jgi:hypothetical protein
MDYLAGVLLISSNSSAKGLADSILAAANSFFF